VVAYPQPASGNRVYFWYALEGPAKVGIEVYNVSGERAAAWEEDHAGTGYARSTWDLTGVAPGVYLYRLRFESAKGTRTTEWKKLVIVKK
jgi:hypothetical protein